ncbi:hypothetical protein FRB95_010587 [Tulasnella sp. JGI-2019a]|nr:hypothetical protein FRB95_010587 [Tulasnella sp. JGI-2019a]
MGRERQASPSETLAFVKLSPEKEETAWTKLKEIADSKLIKVSKKVGRRRATGFTRQVYRECFLVHLMSGQAANENKDLANCSTYIGVSERCCFLYGEFIVMLSDDIRYSGTHDKVCPWAPRGSVPRWSGDNREAPARAESSSGDRDKQYRAVGG